MTYSLFTDGGARGNPGPGAIGVAIKNDADEVIYELSKYIGTCTNNEAEYTALITGLETALSKKISDLKCYIDSELVVKQVNGEYKVKNVRLKELHYQVNKLKTKFKSISFTHVKRNKNKIADTLVNEALDSNGF